MDPVSDLQRAEAQIYHLSRVVAAQAEMLEAYARFVEVTTDRRQRERRQAVPGLAGCEGLDRRSMDRRSGDGQAM